MEDDFQTNLTSFVCLRIDRLDSATIYHSVLHWSLSGQQCSHKSESPRSIGGTRGRTTGISSLGNTRLLSLSFHFGRQSIIERENLGGEVEAAAGRGGRRNKRSLEVRIDVQTRQAKARTLGFEWRTDSHHVILPACHQSLLVCPCTGVNLSDAL